MKTLGKTLTVLLFTLLFLSSASAVWAHNIDYSNYPADLSQIPKPTVPQFTIKLVDSSYDVPSKTKNTTDPYNGQTTTTITPGYHVKCYMLVLSIRNQPYTKQIGDYTFQLYYNIRIKGHFEQWENNSYDFSGNSEAHLSFGNTASFSVISLYSASSLEYTQVNKTTNYNIGDQVDFQVQAIIGNRVTFNTDHIFPIPDYPTFAYSASPWSQTQTFIMPDTSSPSFNADKATTQQTINPTQTTNPTTPIQTTTNPTEKISQVNTVFAFEGEKIVIVVMGIVIVVLLFALIILNKRKQATGKPEVL